MRALITGANGFIGRNLQRQLLDRGNVEIVGVTREHSSDDISRGLERSDVVFHLAGVNRPQSVEEFHSGNVELTRTLCAAAGRVAERAGRRLTVLFASSIQATQDNAYGRSKKAAEDTLLSARSAGLLQTRIFRLPNVFGKWCRPNYNSAVATFCHNVARDLPIQVDDPSRVLQLVYVDDVVTAFITAVQESSDDDPFREVQPAYSISIGDLAERIRSFRQCRETLKLDGVGEGLGRALYATYVSNLPADQFSYDIPQHADARGVFVEILKTRDSGQFSFFTAAPGVTRGSHYHHTKSEKFLVVKGKARFRYRHLMTDERHEVYSSADRPRIVETVPGWVHDITNVGDEEMIVLLWANEVFDRARADTYACEV